MQRIEYRHGRINMQSYNLKLDKLEINLASTQADYQNCNGCNSVEDMLITDGLSSSKGLSLRGYRKWNLHLPYWNRLNG